MRDDLTFVERVHRDLRDVRWPEPAEIRARARRRSRRTAATGGARPCWCSPGRPPSPSSAPGRGAAHQPWWPPPRRPRRGEIPAEALLQPADLPADERRAAQRVGPGRAGPGRRDAPAPARQNQGLPADWRDVAAGPGRRRCCGTAPTASPPHQRRAVLSQDLYRLDAGGGGPVLRRPRPAGGPLRRVAQRRARTRRRAGRSPGEAVHRLDGGAAATSPATRRSLLRHTVVRSPATGPTGKPLGDLPRPTSDRWSSGSGDLVAVLSRRRDGTEPELRRLAAVPAARRMCLAADPPC